MTLACPDCPHCGNPPIYVLDEGRQAMCMNDDCDVIMWDATQPPGQLRDAEPQVVRWDRIVPLTDDDGPA